MPHGYSILSMCSEVRKRCLDITTDALKIETAPSTSHQQIPRKIPSNDPRSYAPAVGRA